MLSTEKQNPLRQAKQSEAAYSRIIIHPQDSVQARALSGSSPPWELTPIQQTYLKIGVSVSQWRPFTSSLDVKGVH